MPGRTDRVADPGPGRQTLSQREALHARENFVPAKIACQNGRHLESASWRLARGAPPPRPGAAART